VLLLLLLLLLQLNPTTSFGFEDSVIIPGRQLTVRPPRRRRAAIFACFPFTRC
jgi:hypothetical protein